MLLVRCNIRKTFCIRRICSTAFLKQEIAQCEKKEFKESTRRLGQSFFREVTKNASSIPNALRQKRIDSSITVQASAAGTGKRLKHTFVVSHFPFIGGTERDLSKLFVRNMANGQIPEECTNQRGKPVLSLSAHKIFRELLTDELLTVVHAFTQSGHEVRIVGGAVRDILLSRHLPKDIDLATTATPDEMVAVFKQSEIRYIETGLDHGTLTAHLNGHNFEITTLRIDTEHDGRRAVVEFTNDWRLDAERRDLTINAMSIDFDGNLYDYFGGVDDLNAKHVRFVGDPEKRIKEDYLRILRYFRFYGRISETANDHVKTTLEVIKKCASGLRNVAVERVWTELSRILTAHFAPSLLKLMYELGVAENIGKKCLTS